MHLKNQIMNPLPCLMVCSKAMTFKSENIILQKKKGGTKRKRKKKSLSLFQACLLLLV